MNELINLKAFIKNTQKIIYVIGVNYSTNELYYCNENVEFSSVKVEEVTVLLGSGFKDANDNEIFEGDILGFVDNDVNDDTFIVERHGYSSNLFFKERTSGIIYNPELFVGQNMEILGSIYAEDEEEFMCERRR